MSLLTFAIPTYNRAAKLKTTLTSIAKQATALPEHAEIFVSDHGSTDHTAVVVEEVQREFPAVHITYAVLPREPDSDFQHNFQFAFSAPTTPWTWTFGDDDLLLPGRLKAVLDLLVQAEPEDVKFIHVAEEIRASENPGIYRKGAMIELCDEWGWIEMTGFITGNIVHSEELKRAVNLPTWFTHAKNAFPQSCALLEVLAPHRALFLDMPVVTVQDLAPTPQTIKQWETNQTAKRYFYVDEALRDMVGRGVIPPTYSPSFFRYHSYFLWDRLIGNMITQYSNHPDNAMPELWENIEGLAAFLKPQDSHSLLQRIEVVKGTIEAHFESLNKIGEDSILLNRLLEQHNQERFPWRYTGEPQPTELADKVPVGINGLTNVIWFSQIRQRRADKTWLREKDLALGVELGERSLADFPHMTGEVKTT